MGGRTAMTDHPASICFFRAPAAMSLLTAAASSDLQPSPPIRQSADSPPHSPVWLKPAEPPNVERRGVQQCTAPRSD